MAKAAPVLMFGAERALTVDPDRQLDHLARLWIEATETGTVLRDLERRVNAQDLWLDRNRGHPEWAKRATHAWTVRKEHERAMTRIHAIAKDADRTTDAMDDATKDEAQRHIHIWAGTGGPGIYATAWAIVPSTTWVKEAEATSERLRDTIDVPF